MSGLYLVTDGDRPVVLATEHDGVLYGYVPNVKAFVFNAALTVDFLVERIMRYEPISAAQAAVIIKAGTVGKINGRTDRKKLEAIRAESRRLAPTDVLDAVSPAAPVAVRRVDLAKAKALSLLEIDPGQWVVYKVYPAGTNRQVAYQLASDLRRGRVKAFRDIPIDARVQPSTGGQTMVLVARQRVETAPQADTR